ncbi:MAG: sulfatase-like hydrolase/transferase, partial [Chlamydiae bacterium]|nr:sulfatase-like hydrolase/transferase [Chlamydiota bacterium]
DSYLLVQKFLKEPLSEKATIQKLQAQKVMPKKKPNIFLFVTESLREDFMTKEIAPNLHSFKQENIAISNSFSNANNSHHSWFCIFYSKLPFYWDKYKFSNWKSGSVPLQILKQMGYKIHLYTSARLSYYEMDNRIFGQNQYLADSVCFKPHEDGVKAFESDTLIVDQLRKDIQSLSEEGHVFITFLDSTHFNYSWPEETDSVFTPYVDSIDYIGTSCFKKDLEEVKNRYRNAIHYVDKLFGKVVETVKSTKGWDDSVIIFTGDHGEEFMEPRNLFHASELNKPQTNVPIYLKLGMNKEKTAAKKGNIISHIDVFPSVLHHLLEQDYYSSLFDGQSILRKNRHSFVISSRYNASRAPFEFCLNNGNYKLLLRFKDEKQIFQSPYLQVLSMKNAQDESLDWNLALIREQFGESLQKIFSE